MKLFAIALLLAVPVFAEQCEVTGMETRSAVVGGAYSTHDYGHGVVVTTGGPTDVGYRVYTVHSADRIFEVTSRHKLTIGPADCQRKKNKMFVDGVKFTIQSERLH